MGGHRLQSGCPSVMTEENSNGDEALKEMYWV